MASATLNSAPHDSVHVLPGSLPGGRAATDTLPAPAQGPDSSISLPHPAHWPQHLVVFTDAWHPQVNGVVQTWSYMRRELTRLGVRVNIIGAASPSLPVPGEPGLRLALRPTQQVQRAIAQIDGGAHSVAVHIATEGPLGWAARRWALQRRLRFTTSFHTRFPEYFERRFGLPARWTTPVLRRFHAASEAVLVPTQHMASTLRTQGFARVQLWPRGVDTDTFMPAAGARDALDRAAGRVLPRPIFLSVGRVAPEKNLEAFLSLRLPGSQVVVGDGPALASLRRRYPQAVWLGAHKHDALGPFYAAADVFVFPSHTDTFGLVMLEAMACATPVAAFPVTGPLDVVDPGCTGVLDMDLERACMAALALPRETVRAGALRHAWRDCAITLGNALVAQALPAAA